MDHRKHLDVTGQVIIREAPIPVNVMGHISGSIVEVISNEGAVVERMDAHPRNFRHRWGNGWRTRSRCRFSDAPLTKALIQPTHRDKILCGGAVVGNDAIRKQFGRVSRG